jgi:hypothetical protein
MNRMIVLVSVLVLTGLPLVYANEVNEPDQDKCVCIELPRPDACGLETLTEEKPEVVCVTLAEKAK